MLRLDERFSHDGRQVAWGVLGEGPPMVLIHGFPWSAQSWRRIAPWLARRYRVHVFDMLGAGLSDKSPDLPVNEAVQSDLLAALLEHWGLTRPHVVGHDFGGLCALRGHFVHGLDYAGLHLVDAVAVLPSGSPFFAHVAQHEAAFAGLPDYAHQALFRAYIGNAAHLPLREDAVETYLAPWRGETGKPAFYRMIAQADPDNIAEAEALYRPTPFDTHLIWGARDTFIPPDRGRRLASLIGGRSFTELPDAGHLVQEDAPEALLGGLLHSL